jgi:hypothetical protein
LLANASTVSDRNNCEMFSWKHAKLLIFISAQCPQF